MYALGEIRAPVKRLINFCCCTNRFYRPCRTRTFRNFRQISVRIRCRSFGTDLFGDAHSHVTFPTYSRSLTVYYCFVDEFAGSFGIFRFLISLLSVLVCASLNKHTDRMEYGDRGWLDTIAFYYRELQIRLIYWYIYCCIRSPLKRRCPCSSIFSTRSVIPHTYRYSTW